MRWLRGLGRPDRVLLGLALAHVLVSAWVFTLVGDGALHGDEAAYADGGRALSNLARDLGSLRAPDTAELSRNVVASGWFMPGMAVVTAPWFLVVPDGDVAGLRAYLAVVSTLLLLLAAWRVRRVLGAVPAGALLVLPGLVPTWAAFSMGVWGDLLAGLVVVLLLCELVVVGRGLRAGTAPSVGRGVGLGVLAVAAVYLRSSTSLLVVGLGVVTVLAAVLLLRGRERLRGLGVAALGGVAFLAVLAPWSIAASAALDAPVVTTTTVPTVLANTFGDRDEVCFGPCDPGSTLWFSPLRYARETGAATGTPETEVLEQMSTHARADVTPGSYSRDVLRNLHDYTKDPDRFLTWLGAPSGPSRTLAAVLTSAMVWSGFAAGVALLLTVARRHRDLQVLGVLLTLSLGALLTQPFVHVSGPRYWTTAAPVLGLGAAWVWAVARSRREGAPYPAGFTPVPDAPPGREGVDAAYGTWLVRVQALLAAGCVAVAVGVVGLAVLG
ncbi:hypothetical protein ACOACO_05480 [Nocardioides sp. CPCC 205120]|uniref:hypothetical protein n=1 Tax=Nocardioides sp. CPCC 205120 TaxID=3406462 RepID=UPI003B5030A1